MKKYIMMLVMAAATTMHAKDIHTLVVSTNPQMHCAGCENKIKSNIRFEKGVKDIQTSVEKQTVTIKYDADKGSQKAIIEGFKKIGFEVTIISDNKEEKKKK